MDLFLKEYNLFGLIIGICTFLVIGIFHPLVIKAEYYWGTKSWFCFLFLGIICTYLSIVVSNILLSVVFGVTAFTSFWSIHEVFKQKQRVEKGWFPANPKK